MILKEFIKRLQSLADQGYKDFPVLIEDWNVCEHPKPISDTFQAEYLLLDGIFKQNDAPNCILLRAKD